MPPWLIALLPSLIGAGGALGSSMLSRADINRMNRYNDPTRQLQRLNAAGLPFAAFAAGQSGSQSSLPDTSGVATAGEHLANYMTTVMQKEQLKLLKEQVRNAAATADITENNRDISNSDTQFELGADPQDSQGRSRRINAKDMEHAVKYLTKAKADQDYNFATWEYMAKEAGWKAGNLDKKIAAEWDIFINKNAALKQALEFEGNERAAKQKILNTMKKGGLSFIEALLIVAMESLSGGAKGKSFNIGF